MKNALHFSPQANQDLRTWVISITKCARQVVIATARNAAGSNPEDLKAMINMDCFVGCAASQ
jgi:mRNA-degrading endonuclease HigB of HigAB toxin-antitoxin module